MPQTCSICNHADRLQIEAALVARKSLRDIAGQFSVSRNATHRHKHHCMKSAIEAVQVEQAAQTDERSAWNALAEMQWMHEQMRAIYKEALAGKDYRVMLQALGEDRKQTELFSKLLSSTEQSSQEQQEQEWLNVREIIFAALSPYPEARLAVARVLLALGMSDDHNDGQRLG